MRYLSPVFKVYLSFFSSFFAAPFLKNGKRKLAFRSLIQPHSYRIHQDGSANRLSRFFRYFIQACRLTWRKKTNGAWEIIHDTEGALQRAIYCSLPWQKSSFLGYLEFIEPGKACCIVYRDLLTPLGLFMRLSMFFFLCLQALLLFPVVLFSSRRDSCR